jgi:hypothetical protein
MKNLEKLYENDFNNIFPLQRKIQIIYPYTIIKGANKSGKSYLLFDYLKRFTTEKYLYINFDDLRFDTKTILYNLDRFLLKNYDIEILALDNCPNLPQEFFDKISHIKSVILTTTVDFSLENYINIVLTPLDFEEYILFDTKHQNSTNSFNSFLKYGNFPEIASFDENKRFQRNQEILKLISNNALEFEILKLYISCSGETKSTYWLFNIFKKSNKISKDMFYKISKSLQEKNILYFCQKYNSPKSPKKIFSYNHCLLNIVNIDKNLNNILSNMVFLELNNHYKDIYYLDSVDFYIPKIKSIVLVTPFLNNFINISTKILPLLDIYEITNISIITINTTKEIFIGDIQCEVLPFYEWALGL